MIQETKLFGLDFDLFLMDCVGSHQFLRHASIIIMRLVHIILSFHL